METKIPTDDEIRATFETVRRKVGCASLCLDATIDDYPIGRRERGKCSLRVERATGISRGRSSITNRNDSHSQVTSGLFQTLRTPQMAPGRPGQSRERQACSRYSPEVAGTPRRGSARC